MIKTRPFVTPLRIVRSALAALVCIVALPVALAAYPDRPIRIVVPYAPGGTGDVIARLVGQQLSTTLGQQVIVDNKPGGAGVIGATNVARSAADGYTILMGYTSEMVITPAIIKSVSYSTARDFVPLALAGSTPLVLVTNTSSGIKTYAELVAKAKTKPDAVSFASAGNGSPAHIAAALMAKSIGAQMLHIPYKGGAQAVADVVAGQVDVYFSGIPPTVSFIKTGRLVALGVASTHPSPALPGVAPLGQQTPTLDLSGWFGFFAPKGTPPEITKRLYEKIAQALAAPEVRNRLIEQGVESQPMTSEAFGAFVSAEEKRYARFLTELNIQAE